MLTNNNILQFFAGVLFFGLVVKFIPEPTVVPTADAGKKQVGMSSLNNVFTIILVCFQIPRLNRI